MIPLRDDNPIRRGAIVVPALIVINLVMFIFVQPSFGAGTTEQRNYAVCSAAIPYEITHGRSAAEAARRGDVDPSSSIVRVQEAFCPNKNVWLSVLRSMFLHAGFLHIAGNMLYLWIFGNNIEDRLGRARFLLFYLLCGLIATFAQSFVSPDSGTPMVGASGAIAGVLGAYLLAFPRARVRTLVIFFFITIVDLPAVVVLGLWFLLQVFQGLGSVTGSTGVAYMAHVGGFIAGMLLLGLFRPRRPPARLSL
ncbi:MAG: rhomboid family intramembrane serine protease [Actinomycetota bacterium]